MRSYPTVTTDMIAGTTSRSNTPFSFTLDRVKLIGDYAGGLPASMRITGGGEYDMRERTYQEVVTTREYDVLGQGRGATNEKLSTWLKYAYSGRDNSVYGTSVWFGYPENPLLRKFYLADRQRNMIEGRLDYAFSQKISLGVSADYADDDYSPFLGRSHLGAQRKCRLRALGGLHRTDPGPRVPPDPIDPFAAERQPGLRRPRLDRAREGRVRHARVWLKHVAIPDKLDIGADLTFSRSRSDTSVDNATDAPPFPTAKTRVDAFKLYGTYKLKDDLSIIGSYHYEHYDSQDWRLDGIAPATVSNLLALGAQPPNYSLNVFRVALRFRF